METNNNHTIVPESGAIVSTSEGFIDQDNHPNFIESNTQAATMENWLCEEFSLEWKAYSVGKIPQHTLYVNEDFERIYTSDFLEGNFGSCMVDKEYFYFYKSSVKAKAAYLETATARFYIYLLLAKVYITPPPIDYTLMRHP